MFRLDCLRRASYTTPILRQSSWTLHPHFCLFHIRMSSKSSGFFSTH